MANFDGLAWCISLLVILAVLQRRLHFETQAVLLVLTRRAEIALALFSLLFFPGVLLHEASHYFAARLLGVRTGKFSLLPQPLPNGRLRLGYVETIGTDPLRDALIGVAPLVAGSAFVAYAGLLRLGLPALWDGFVLGEAGALSEALSSVYARPDFWLWFYLTLAVSSTMLPSASDRRAWLPVFLMIALLVGLALLAGVGPWLLANLTPPFNQALRSLAILFGISASFHLILLPPLWAFRQLVTRVTGLNVR